MMKSTEKTTNGRTMNSKVDARELKQMLDRGERILVLNVLPEKSFEQEHIPGSENIPLDTTDDFGREVESLAGSKDRQIVVHCSSPTCKTSHKAAQTLEQTGFENVIHFEGGMEGWKKQGYNVDSGATAASGAAR